MTTTDDLRATARAAMARARQLARAYELRHLAPPRVVAELDRAAANLLLTADAIDHHSDLPGSTGLLWRQAYAYQDAARARLVHPACQPGPPA